MVSIHETFGLVYLEALSQGLPILFSKNDGIDGTLPQNVGEAVDPLSPQNVKKGLINLIQNYHEYSNEAVDFKTFKWKNIAQKYHDIYLKNIKI